ncbi:HupE/UreJ family protein [Acidovorax sp. LjRoot66]|uniref:HupE/UreJ family protein n=1 Tax=Acidovorax sp. LjRoot66 TaxID=3342334 RepID=UPI003ED08D24
MAVALAAACAAAPSAWAHKASDAYLRVAGAGEADPARADAVALQLSLALKDVDAALDLLDADGDRQLTWGEIRQATPAVAAWVGQGIRWQCGDAVLAPAWRFEALEQRTDGRYIRMAAALDCAATQALALDYRLMQGIDPTHRLLVSGQLGGQPLAAVLAPDGRSRTDLRTVGGSTVESEAATARSAPATLAHFVSEGVHHILEGYDHLAFLLALLLPITLLRRHAVAQATAPSGPWGGVKALLLTVTSFTVGHSVTLVLAGLGWVTVSGNWVEPAIAISIGISALLNLFPVKGLRSDLLALCFGLVHGLGFSGALVEAGVSGGLLVWALAGFNLGVEAGQLMVVAVWCAVSLLLARWAGYRTVVVKGGSVALIVLSLYWTVQRIAFSG